MIAPSPRPVRAGVNGSDRRDSDGPGSLGPQPRRRCRASARLQGGDTTAPSPRAVRFRVRCESPAIELTRTGRDLSDRSWWTTRAAGSGEAAATPPGRPRRVWRGRCDSQRPQPEPGAAAGSRRTRPRRVLCISGMIRDAKDMTLYLARSRTLAYLDQMFPQLSETNMPSLLLLRSRHWIS